MFESEARIHPIYFATPYSEVDDVTIALPRDWQIFGLPEPQHGQLDLRVLPHRPKAGHNHPDKRQLAVTATFLDVKSYPTLRTFFQRVRAGDEQQVLLSGTRVSR